MIKWFELFYKSILSKKINLFFLIIIFNFYKINSADVVPYLKVIYIGNNFYYLIYPEQINYYKPDVTNILVHSLNGGQKIQSEEELKMVNFGDFKDNNNKNILIIKKYLHYVFEDDYSSNEQNTNINGYSSEIITLMCNTLNCFYILGIINNAKELYLYLYKKPTLSITSTLLKSYKINNVGSENISCQLMKFNSNNVLTCFYQNDNETKEIVSSSFNIDTSSNGKIEIIESLINSEPTNGAKIIKSKISQDGTQSYVCYITDENNCDCLIYDINNNEWKGNKTYLNDCISSSNSLYFDYYDISNEFFLYCFQSSMRFSLIKLNQNFQIENENFNGIYDLEDYILNEKNCQNYFLSTLVYDSNAINVLLTCNNTLIRKKSLQKSSPYILGTTINTFSSFPISTEIQKLNLISNTIIFSDEISLTEIISTNNEVNYNNNKNIIQERSDKTKEEIIENLDKAMENYDIGKIYEIFGNDYNIKISPINTHIYENISTFINFTNCENILKRENKINSSSILTVYQIEIDNNYEKSLINDVEYVVFNEDKKIVDLSVCENEMIEIKYNLNLSGINLTKMNYYAEHGIDIFNIEDKFFNDICYTYSENNSDMILNDRISDIYENYSLCENNCQYDKINTTDNTVTCKCLVKINTDPIVETPNLDIVIRDSIKDSNLGVIKCYKLVFNFKNKEKNIGFWIFTILIFLHIPIFIYYFIFNIKHIKKYILKEMGKYHYLYQIKNPKKKKENKNNRYNRYTIKKCKSHKLSFAKKIIDSSKKVLIFNKKKDIAIKRFSNIDGYNENNSQSNSKSSNNLNKSELLNINKINMGKRNNRKEKKFRGSHISNLYLENKKQSK